jgi:hypothetical protein
MSGKGPPPAASDDGASASASAAASEALPAPPTPGDAFSSPFSTERRGSSSPSGSLKDDHGSTTPGSRESDPMAGNDTPSRGGLGPPLPPVRDEKRGPSSDGIAVPAGGSSEAAAPFSFRASFTIRGGLLGKRETGSFSPPAPAPQAPTRPVPSVAEGSHSLMSKAGSLLRRIGSPPRSESPPPSPPLSARGQRDSPTAAAAAAAASSKPRNAFIRKAGSPPQAQGSPPSASAPASPPASAWPFRRSQTASAGARPPEHSGSLSTGQNTPDPVATPGSARGSPGQGVGSSPPAGATRYCPSPPLVHRPLYAAPGHCACINSGYRQQVRGDGGSSVCGGGAFACEGAAGDTS